MSIKCAIVMDPISKIAFKKDTSLGLLLAAKRRQWELYYLEQDDLFVKNDIAYGRSKSLEVHDNAEHWFDFGAEKIYQLSDFDVIFMRVDPPFDMEYIYTTYMLELAEANGALVVNKPQSLRDANEKMFSSWFPDCTPPSIVTRDSEFIMEFISEHKDAVIKPLDGKGGKSIFRLQEHGDNVRVAIETVSEYGTRYVTVQKYLPEITEGDKRIFIVDGKPIPYALARIPPADDFRGNLSVGAKGVGVELTKRDYWLCEKMGPLLKEKGLLFVGIDVIGEYVTEINVTGPTCIREIETIFNINIADILLDCLQQRLSV